MFFLSKQFDPFFLLQIDTSTLSTTEEAEKLRVELVGKIDEYILYKLSADLSQEQLDQLLSLKNDQGKMSEKMQSFFPDFAHRIQKEIEDFKIEYKQTS